MNINVRKSVWSLRIFCHWLWLKLRETWECRKKTDNWGRGDACDKEEMGNHGWQPAQNATIRAYVEERKNESTTPYMVPKWEKGKKVESFLIFWRQIFVWPKKKIEIFSENMRIYTIQQEQRRNKLFDDWLKQTKKKKNVFIFFSLFQLDIKRGKRERVLAMIIFCF